jgi:FixJ family two-component response regulator
MQPSARVFVLDDDPAVRDHLRLLLQSVGLAVQTYSSGEQFLEAYDPEEPGCVVLDVRMPGLSGLEVQARLAQLPYCPPVILLTGYGDVPTTVRAMKAGAVDVLEKPYPPQVLLDRIQQALEWDAQMRRDRAFRLDIQARLAALNPRERDVLDLVVAGKPNKVIAAHLNLSEKMIEVHRARVMEKMRAESLAELVRLVLVVRS